MIRAAAGLASVVLFASACSGSQGHGGSTAAKRSSTICAWAAKAGRDVQNIAYPDTSATYWSLTYSLAKGERLVLRGQFAHARYQSLITYAPTGGAIKVLSDRDTLPDRGSTNPFRGGPPSATPRRYTAVIAAPGGSGTNLLDAAPAGTPSASSPTTELSREQRQALTRAVGSGGAHGVRGTLIYRVYVPTTPADPTGGVGLPAVWLASDHGSTRVRTCARPSASPYGLAIVDRYGPATNGTVPSTPVFIRPNGPTANNLYPDPDNVYVATLVRHRAGQVVVVRAKAPTFPDTRAGASITGDEQVRYWSLCTNEYRKPYPVTACKRDDQTVLDGAGDFTFVISTPADRPSNATAAHGVTWLDYGNPNLPSLLLLRNLLASSTFPESAANLPRGALASSTMGAYAPRGAYCSRSTFQAGGAAACGL